MLVLFVMDLCLRKNVVVMFLMVIVGIRYCLFFCLGDMVVFNVGFFWNLL